MKTLHTEVRFTALMFEESQEPDVSHATIVGFTSKELLAEGNEDGIAVMLLADNAVTQTILDIVYKPHVTFSDIRISVEDDILQEASFHL